MRTSNQATPALPQVSRDVVVIGGSAGALNAMVEICNGLPKGYRGSLFIVSHIGSHPSQLPALLTEAGPLPASHARQEETIRPGRIYVAPPDRHLILTGGRVVLSQQPREHFARPAIDPLFRSAARTYGPCVVGVLLSGSGSDGTVGLQAIRDAGGTVIVQDPTEAAFPEMPITALTAVPPDFVVTSGGIAELLAGFVSQPLNNRRTEGDPPAVLEVELEEPYALTCPECGGAVREITGTGLVAYRCHTGHRFNADEFLVHQIGDVENALMIAVRVLRERTALCGRMIEDAKSKNRSHGVAYWGRLRQEADDQMRVLQQFLNGAPHEGSAFPGEIPTISNGQ